MCIPKLVEGYGKNKKRVLQLLFLSYSKLLYTHTKYDEKQLKHAYFYVVITQLLFKQYDSQLHGDKKNSEI